MFVLFLLALLVLVTFLGKIINLGLEIFFKKNTYYIIWQEHDI